MHFPATESLNRIKELSRLEKITKLIYFNHQPITTMTTISMPLSATSAFFLNSQGSQFQYFTTLPEMKFS